MPAASSREQKATARLNQLNTAVNIAYSLISINGLLVTGEPQQQSRMLAFGLLLFLEDSTALKIEDQLTFVVVIIPKLNKFQKRYSFSLI